MAGHCNLKRLRFTIALNMNKYLLIGLQSLALLALVALTGCSMLQKKIDPSTSYSTESGFSFKFPMSGEWYPAELSKRQYAVGEKPFSDGTTKLAIVRHGPIWTPAGKSLSNKELFDGFKRDIEKEAQFGRVGKVKSNFVQKKYHEADCLFFDQTGEDNGTSTPMSLSNDGMICLHPKRKYQFIWMALSERRPLGKPVNDRFENDKRRFFESLEFID